ncbi:superoxide dismutase family protein [Sporosarcina saromensis]|uniref:Superoxide dismutase [Cu-Zn] n=1 Tax=Sporosarcina saromensis TaxID=359365 RepID=A0ABU4GD78_9BACL|nr:superoxide dismutase family protein [Sporosarcina saromensis]MDW0114278.1 superoxide dismutase family protein [Sporosarcina saromensis]
MNKKIITLLAISTLLVSAGCVKSDKKVPVSGEQMKAIVSPLINTEGVTIGEVSLVQEADGVAIHVEAENLSPGVHGIHIHETGICTAPDFKSAGGHFNPTGKEHGFDNPKGFHLGDLPNIEVNEQGKVSRQLISPKVTLKPGMENSLLKVGGTAIVIHEKEDDYKTDPAGDSGDRVACATITQ